METNSLEQNLTKCKMCGELKLRKQEGKFNHKDKKWTDEKGGLWNGLTCPRCNRIRMKHLVKAMKIASKHKIERILQGL